MYEKRVVYPMYLSHAIGVSSRGSKLQVGSDPVVFRYSKTLFWIVNTKVQGRFCLFHVSLACFHFDICQGPNLHV